MLTNTRFGYVVYFRRCAEFATILSDYVGEFLNLQIVRLENRDNVNFGYKCLVKQMVYNTLNYINI